MSTSLISGGEVQPRISPGDRGLACGTVTLKLWLSSNSEATDCRVAANWMVLTKPNLGFGSVKNKKIDQKNLYIPSKFWVTCQKRYFLKFYKYWVSLCDITRVKRAASYEDRPNIAVLSIYNGSPWLGIQSFIIFWFNWCKNVNMFTLRSKINQYGFNEVNRVYVDRYENIEHFDVGRTINRN